MFTPLRGPSFPAADAPVNQQNPTHTVHKRQVVTPFFPSQGGIIMSDGAGRVTWLATVSKHTSAMAGISDSIAAVASCLGKRDLSTLWDLDPVAAPPQSVRRCLERPVEVPCDEGAEVASTGRRDATDTCSDDLREQRAVLEVQLRFAMRARDEGRVCHIARQLRAIDEHNALHALNQSRMRGELRVGDPCYALGKVVEWEWYHARLMETRTRSPQLRIEYVATLDDANSNALALPVPRKNFVPLTHVRLDRPTPGSDDEVIRPPAHPCVCVPGLLSEDA